MVPSANHFTTRAATSSGVEKKNGGSSGLPPTGIVVRTCHSAIETTATSTCNAVNRTTIHHPPSGLGVTLEHFVLEHVPDLAMQFMERAIELDLGDIARPRDRNPPVADDARRRPRRHDHHAVGQRDRLLKIVGDEHHRLAVGAPQVEQQIAHDLTGLRIERTERLVHQQDFRIADQHLGETNALALPTGQHVRIARRRTRQGQRASASLVRAASASCARRPRFPARSRRCRVRSSRETAPRTETGIRTGG